MAEPTTQPSTNSASFLPDNHFSTIVKTGSETIATATRASPALNLKPNGTKISASSTAAPPEIAVFTGASVVGVIPNVVCA